MKLRNNGAAANVEVDKVTITIIIITIIIPKDHYNVSISK
jgi:hypothetical protein